MSTEILTSFEKDNKQYALLEIKQDEYAVVKNNYFETYAKVPFSIRCPEIDEFKIKAWLINDCVNFAVYYHDDNYKLKFNESAFVDYSNLELFKEDIQAGITITIYLTNLFICVKNGIIDYKIQLMAKCRNAEHLIGSLKDTIKL